MVEGRGTFAQRTRQVFAVKGGVDSFLVRSRAMFFFPFYAGDRVVPAAVKGIMFLFYL